jgi:hypothetical protein
MANIRPFQPGELEDVFHPFGHHRVVQNLFEHRVAVFFRQLGI